MCPPNVRVEGSPPIGKGVDDPSCLTPKGGLLNPGSGRRWWIAYYVNGKEYRESGGKTEKAAERKLKDRLKEIYGERFVGPQQERVLVNGLLDSLIAEQEGNRAKDLRTVKIRVKPLRAFFGQYRAVDVTPTLVKRYVAERLADEKTRATVNREVSTLRRAFNLARE